MLLLLAAALLVTVGCSPNIDVAQWSEEVLLHDGKVIVLERQAKRRPSGFPDTRRGALLHESLRYPPMGVEWKADDHRRVAFSFEVLDGVPHLVVYVRMNEWCRNKDPKQFTAEFFRWEGGRWVEMRQENFPTQRALANLYAGYWGASSKTDAKGLVTWGEKAREDGFRPDAPDTVHDWFTRSSRNCAQYHINLPK